MKVSGEWEILDQGCNLDLEGSYTCDSHKLYKQHCLHIDASAKFIIFYIQLFAGQQLVCYIMEVEGPCYPDLTSDDRQQ